MFSISPTILIAILHLSYTNGHRVYDSDFGYGITIETIEAPILYDTFIPIIYKFELPQWKPEDLQVKWPPGNSDKCYSSDKWNWSWDQQACPVVHHYNSLIHQILHNMTAIWKSDTFSEKSFVISEPNKISAHFKGNQLSSEGLKDYLTSLKRNSFGNPVVSNMSQFKNVNASVYTTMLSNFRKTSVTSIADESTLSISSSFLFIKYAVLTNSYTAIQAMEILNFYMERNRWAEAFSTCKLSQIPTTLVSQSDLLKSLHEIEQQLFVDKGSKQRIYSLSINKSELSAYFHLPLTDCTFTTDNTYIVRILVPIKKIHSTASLIRIKTIPFFRSEENDQSELCEMDVLEGTFVSHDFNSNLIQESNCISGEELCKIPDLSQWSPTSPCLSAILNGNLEKVISMCHMNCQVYPSNSPYFKKIGSDKYAIAGELYEYGETETFVMLDSGCTKNQYEIVKGNKFGAIIITLPCNCVLKYLFHKLIASDPCNETAYATIQQVIPYLWLPTENADELEQDEENSEEISTEVSQTHDTEVSIDDTTDNNDYVEMSAENGTMNETIEEGVEFMLDHKEFLPQRADYNNNVKVKELENMISHMHMQIFVLWACLVILMIVVLFMIVVLKNISTNCMKSQRSASNVYTI